VLEEKRFRRLGEVRDRHVDIRLIAATHHDLSLLVREKKFRSDIYFRISTIPLVVPLLRDRAEDIPLLVQHVLGKLAVDLGRGDVRLGPDAEQALQAYSWPGNIRELRNVLERALLLSGRSVLGRQDLRFDAPLAADIAMGDEHLTLLELERRHIERVLHAEHGHVERAARRLGIPRSSLYQKIKKFGIVLPKVQNTYPNLRPLWPS
jgi:DNA-binding NtrC family response regulator